MTYTAHSTRKLAGCAFHVGQKITLQDPAIRDGSWPNLAAWTPELVRRVVSV